VNGSRWIMVVDDDEDVREMIMLVLALEGFEVVGARDGLDALQQVGSRGCPGLAFLDLRMPRLNGPDFVRAIQGNPTYASVPIVILSGDATAIEAARSLGVLDLLTKPVELERLVATASRVVSLAKPAERQS